MTLGADVGRLMRTRPFSLMPREAVQLIAFSCERKRLRQGEPLFGAGEAAEAGYFVLSGALLLEDPRAPETARRAAAGALVGESALYAPVARRVAARAAEETIVALIPRDTFRRVLAEFPDAAGKVRAALAERTRRLVDDLEAAGMRSLDGRPFDDRARP